MDFETDYPELPTLPSDMERFQRAADVLAERVQQIPLEKMASSLIATLEGLDRLVNSQDVAVSIEELRATLTQTRALVERLNRQSGPLLASAQSTLDEATQTLAHFDERLGPLADAATRTLARADRSLAGLEPDSALSTELNRTLTELRKAAQAIRRLAETLDTNPNSVVFGRPRGGEQ